MWIDTRAGNVDDNGDTTKEVHMLTKSTARYFAKQAYQYRLMTGRKQTSAKQGKLTIVHCDNSIVVMDTESPARFTIPIAKCWANL